MKRGKPYRGYCLSSLNCPLSEFYSKLSSIIPIPPPTLRNIPDIFVASGASIIDAYNRHFKGEWRDMYDPVRAEMSACDWSVSAIHAEKDLDFNPRDPDESLEETIEWIEDNLHLQKQEIHSKL